MPFADVRGIRTYYRQEGSGPELVLIHGIGGNAAGWYLSGLVSLAAPWFRVTALDLRGHGNSEVPPDRYTSRDLALDLLEFMSTLRIRDAILLGHCFGAVVAAHVAVLAPDVAKGLVLSEAHFPGLTELRRKPNEWVGWQAYRQKAATLGVVVSQDLIDLESILQQFDTLSPSDVEQIERVMGAGALHRLQRLTATTCGQDVGLGAGLDAEAISQITHQVECVYGEHSPFIATRDYLAAHLPRCTPHTIPQVEHFAFDEDPESFQQVIAECLCAVQGLDLSQFGTIKKGELLTRRETLVAPRPSAS